MSGIDCRCYIRYLRVKQRKVNWVLLKLIFVQTYYYVCKTYVHHFSTYNKKIYLGTNSAHLLREILGLLFPHGNGRLTEKATKKEER